MYTHQLEPTLFCYLPAPSSPVNYCEVTLRFLIILYKVGLGGGLSTVRIQRRWGQAEGAGE